VIDRKSKYIRFSKIQRPPNRTTDIVAVENIGSGERIGTIAWHSPFRKYAFFPVNETVFDADCLSDIEAVVRDMMARWEEDRG
jgi:hypothetical protein